MGTFTVRENLLFSANLRLNPSLYTNMDKQVKVDDIIQELGLTDCANTKVQTLHHRSLPKHITCLNRLLVNAGVYVLLGFWCFRVCSDRDRVPARRVGGGEEEVQHRDGACHVSVAAVPRRAHHRAGFKHRQQHHQSTAQVLQNYLLIPC